MAIWDHTILGYPLSGGYSFNYSQKLKTFEVLGGSARYRLNDKYAPYIVSLKWNFTKNQFIAFEQFYLDVLQQGSKSFDMTLITGVGFVEQICIFEDGYNYVKVGNNTEVTAKLLVKRDLSLVVLP